MSPKNFGYNPIDRPKPLPILETPDPDKKFPLPPNMPGAEEKEQEKRSGIRDKTLDLNDEFLMENVVAARVAIDEVRQAYLGIEDIDHWEPEEKWEIIEKLTKLSEAIAKLQHPFDLAAQTAEHVKRMYVLDLNKQVEYDVIDYFLKQAEKWINRTNEDMEKNKQKSEEEAA